MHRIVFVGLFFVLIEVAAFVFFFGYKSRLEVRFLKKKGVVCWLV